MPCQVEETDQCFTKPDATHCALIHAKTRIDPGLFGQHMNVETVVTRAHPGNGWVYLLRSETAQTYEALDAGLKKLDQHLLQTTPSTESNFHVIGPENESIVLGGSNTLFCLLIEPSTGNFQPGVDVWRMNRALPPRKRVTHDNADIQLLIPGFKRLSKQLQVDFCINVHGSEGKRRREPVRSIYEEAAMESATKKKRTRRTPVRKVHHAPPSSTDNDCGDISSLDDDEMLQHAETLVNLSGRQEPAEHKQKKPTSSSIVVAALTRAMDAVSQAHAVAIKAKDDTIKAMETASQALAETVRAQSALITNHCTIREQ